MRVLESEPKDKNDVDAALRSVLDQVASEPVPDRIKQLAKELDDALAKDSVPPPDAKDPR